MCQGEERREGGGAEGMPFLLEKRRSVDGVGGRAGIAEGG